MSVKKLYFSSSYFLHTFGVIFIVTMAQHSGRRSAHIHQSCSVDNVHLLQGWPCLQARKHQGSQQNTCVINDIIGWRKLKRKLRGLCKKLIINNNSKPKSLGPFWCYIQIVQVGRIDGAQFWVLTFSFQF